MAKYDACIGGYYGFGNLGDEAMLASLCGELRRRFPDVRICVLSADPEKTRKSLGVDSVNRCDPIAVLQAMMRSRLYISGSGSLLQDETSRKSLFYYTGMMMLGKLLCGRMCVYANGAGRLRSKTAAAAALGAADRISVRDPESAQMICRMGIGMDEICIGADPALLTELEPVKVQDGKRFFAVSLRPLDGDFDIDAVCSFCRSEGDLVPVFVSMQDKYDMALCSYAAKKCGGRVLSPSSFEELVGVLREAEFAIGMRLHFLIASALAGTLFGALSYDMKTDGFMAYIENSAVLDASEVTKESLPRLKDKLMRADTDRLEVLRSRAKEDILALGDMVAEGRTDKKSSRAKSEKIKNIR